MQITRFFSRFTFLIICSAAFLDANATGRPEDQIYASGSDYPKVIELNWINRKFLDRQRKSIDELVRRHYGTQIHKNKSDLALLQRIINDELINKSDKEQLQALGVILGDIYVTEKRDLNWKVFEDDLGKSHAVCLDETKHCLFPITMLSRRIEAGLSPKTTRVYEKGMDQLQPHFKKLPFSGRK